MADDADDPENAAARLEAALERIARRAARAVVAMPPAESHGSDTAELADRLDNLIDRLRGALAPR